MGDVAMDSFFRSAVECLKKASPQRLIKWIVGDFNAFKREAARFFYIKGVF